MVTIVFTTILHLYAILHFLQAQTIYISTVKQNGCPTCYTYTKLSQHSFLLGNNTFFRFKFKACSSAYVGLMETDSDEGNMYEIAFEGEQNSGGVGIYDGKRGNSLYGVPVSGIMDCYLMKDFYVEWTNNFITVENYVPLSETWVPILTWSSAQLHAINFIGVTTGRHQDGEWEIGNPNIPRVNAHLTETFYTTETMSFPIYTGTYFPLTIHSTVNTTEHVLSTVIPTSSSSFISTALNPSMYTISSPLFPTASNTLTYTLLSPLLSSVPSPSMYTISTPLIPTASNTLTYTLLTPLISTVLSPSMYTISTPLIPSVPSPSIPTISSPLLSTASNPLTHTFLSPLLSSVPSPSMYTISTPLISSVPSQSMYTISSPLIPAPSPSMPISSSQLMATPSGPAVHPSPSQFTHTSTISHTSTLSSHSYYVSMASDCELSCQLQTCTSHQSISPEEMNEKLESLRKELVVEKSTTNKHMRTLISAPDDRTSAAQIGYVGALILSSVGIAIVIMDIPSLVMYFKQFKTKVKHPRIEL